MRVRPSPRDAGDIAPSVELAYSVLRRAPFARFPAKRRPRQSKRPDDRGSERPGNAKSGEAPPQDGLDPVAIG
jgi:hypothetical protein